MLQCDGCGAVLAVYGQPEAAPSADDWWQYATSVRKLGQFVAGLRQVGPDITAARATLARVESEFSPEQIARAIRGDFF